MARERQDSTWFNGGNAKYQGRPIRIATWGIPAWAATNPLTGKPMLTCPGAAFQAVPVDHSDEDNPKRQAGWKFLLKSTQVPKGFVREHATTGVGCIDGCFARDFTYRRESVLKSHQAHLRLIQDPARMVKEITHDLLHRQLQPGSWKRFTDGRPDIPPAPRQPFTIVRIHDSGDFFTNAYLNTWLTIARNVLNKKTDWGKHIFFFGYTKSVHFFRARKGGPLRGDLPPNFRIAFSEGGLYDDWIDRDQDRYSRIFRYPNELREAGFADCTADDAEAFLTGQRLIGLVYHGSLGKPFFTDPAHDPQEPWKPMTTPQVHRQHALEKHRFVGRTYTEGVLGRRTTPYGEFVTNPPRHPGPLSSSFRPLQRTDPEMEWPETATGGLSIRPWGVDYGENDPAAWHANASEKAYPVTNFQEASRTFLRWQDWIGTHEATAQGGAAMLRGATVYGPTGLEVGHVSQNGKVWTLLKDPDDINSADLLYDPSPRKVNPPEQSPFHPGAIAISEPDER